MKNKIVKYGSITDKGQVTIPKTIRDMAGINAKDEVEISVEQDGSIKIAKDTRGKKDRILFNLLGKLQESNPYFAIAGNKDASYEFIKKYIEHLTDGKTIGYIGEIVELDKDINLLERQFVLVGEHLIHYSGIDAKRLNKEIINIFHDDFHEHGVNVCIIPQETRLNTPNVQLFKDVVAQRALNMSILVTQNEFSHEDLLKMGSVILITLVNSDNGDVSSIDEIDNYGGSYTITTLYEQ